MERDHFASGLTNEQLNFNSHAHVERDVVGIYAEPYYFNFNSHAHVERDLYFFAVIKAFAISTHTLTWSVTSNLYAITRIKKFQLTRSRGA